MPKLLAICTGVSQNIQHDGKTIPTGIFKHPIKGPVRVEKLGIQGDRQVDLVNHGGIHQAVYAYFFEGYAFWEKELRQILPYGQFGENLTIEGIDEKNIRIGDVFRIGNVRLQVTQPRQPCFKLDHRIGKKGFTKLFLKSHRLGCYFRVLSEGEIKTDDQIEVQACEGSLFLHDICRLRFFDVEDLEGAAHAASLAHLSPDWKKHFQERLRNEK